MRAWRPRGRVATVVPMPPRSSAMPRAPMALRLAGEPVSGSAAASSEESPSAASLAISSGANVKAVQQMLGHKSAAMTLDTYSGLFADDLDAVAAALDRLGAPFVDGA
jgi:integrase